MRDLLDIPEDPPTRTLQADEPWPFDPPDRDPRNELKRVQAFIKKAKWQAPSVTLFAVPNAGRSSDWERLQRWREGARAGVPDIVATWAPQGIAFLEFKDGSSKPTDQQREWLNRLHRQGHHVGVFRQEDSALAFLRRCGAPFL